jgi:hydrogenase-4 transcriptional activator
MTDSKHRILIIEDEALVARELKSRLTALGYEVVGVAYGRGGIQLAQETEPDLILTDIHLKNGEDGIEMAREIQANRDTPIVFLTAYSDEDTVSRAKAATPYGYIIKPVENRELQITIEMALYKFGIEKELKETQQLLQTALTCLGKGLVFINSDGIVTDLNVDAESILGTTRDKAVGQNWGEVVSIIGSSIELSLQAAFSGNNVNKLAPFIVSVPEKHPRLVDGIIGPMQDGAVLILRELTEINDDIEILPSTEELMAGLGHDRLAPGESSICQLLISYQGGESDDLDRVTDFLNQRLRATDLVSLYGDFQLSVSMPYTSIAEGELIASSILTDLNEEFSKSSVKFFIGLSYSLPGDQEPFELFRQAESALHLAEDSASDRVIVWDENLERAKSEAQLERRGEVDRQREYQNRVLLWNVINVVSRGDSLLETSRKVCSHLRQSFGFEQVALMERTERGFELIIGDSAETTLDSMSQLDLSEKTFVQLDKTLASDNFFFAGDDSYLFKLSSTKLLFFPSHRALADSEIEFLQNLLSYFVASVQRYDLKVPAITIESDPGFVSSSKKMQGVLERVDLVAPTHATVLITGESGSGKEVMAQTVHRNSPRSDKPFIIVDCGAVVGSLIESELFGHTKGAFTGADSHFVGRLKEAEGGTVLLDEIGELPLDVQVKLLRYVENREIAPVGSSRYQSVDTRVIAATHRNLRALVDEGTFREDLFYRLNVFTLEMPPLRERRDDVLSLARHFLSMYAGQYERGSIGFSEDAEQALLQYSWPGNIRELANVVNRGLILCKDSIIGTIHLGIFPSVKTDLVESQQVLDPEKKLESSIKKWVSISLRDQPEFFPLGTLLEQQTISGVLLHHNEVLNRAAISLGIPESTLRRKAMRLGLYDEEVCRDRIPGWEEVNDILMLLCDIAKSEGVPLLDFVLFVLTRELEARRLNKKDAALILGVSVPTYRRMISLSQ